MVLTVPYDQLLLSAPAVGAIDAACAGTAIVLLGAATGACALLNNAAQGPASADILRVLELVAQTVFRLATPGERPS